MVSPRMACVSADSLQGYLDGRLAPGSLAALEDHLDACPACRQLLVAAAAPALDAASAADPSAPDASAAGAIGRYLLERPLGSGGMGVVYAARDPQLQRRVAIKLLHAAAETPRERDELRARLLGEARAMARLSHPNVLPVFEVGEHQGRIFLVMELAPGGTLAEWLLARPRASPEEQAQLLELFLGAGRGLQAAHQAGLVHRDFKPANVLLGAGLRPMVTDFGLARPLDAAISADIKVDINADTGDATRDPIPLEKQARQSAAAGSLAYMAPEQLRGEPVDPRADLFAYCVALFEALHGARPYAGSNAAELLGSIEAGQIRAPAHAPRIAPSLQQALARGLQADPARRFASMAALLESLEQTRPRPGDKRRRATVALASAASVVLLGVLVFAVDQHRRLARLEEDKRALDASIASVLAELGSEQDPARLAALDEQLARLSGSAEEARRRLGAKSAGAHASGREAPGRADAGVVFASLSDAELDDALQTLLARFGAETYLVPPFFKEKLRGHIERLLGNPELRQHWARKQALWDRLTPPFRARGLPEEMAYLAWAESRFDRLARSGSGALGLWQFIPQTARRFGLRVEPACLTSPPACLTSDSTCLTSEPACLTSDERTDVEKSSAAAATYLAELLAEFGSDSFLLAIASYNRGESGMRAALAELSREPGGFRKDKRDFWHLYLRKLLPEETREYVLEVLAAMIVGSRAPLLGLEGGARPR